VKLGTGDRVYGEGNGGAVRQAARGAGDGTVAAPAVAVLLAVSVKVLVAVAGMGLKEAVTPLGKPMLTN